MGVFMGVLKSLEASRRYLRVSLSPFRDKAHAYGISFSTRVLGFFARQKPILSS